MEQPKARLTLQQHQQAINEAIWIDASPHEWPTVDKMWLLCSALIDSVQMVDYLRARLAAVEAERDAARKLYDERQDDWIAERKNLQALNMQLVKNHDAMQAERNAALSTRAGVEALLRDAITERDTAQAGEARAVEALRRCHEGAALQLAEPRDNDYDQYALTAIATDCEAVLAAQGPALDWLAQQRREAVAAWIEKEATKCRQQNGEYYDRGVDCMLREAAALRAGGVGDE